MGVKFDRVLEGVAGPFTAVNELIAPTPAKIVGGAKAGWLISHEINDGFIVTNRLAKAGAPVFWVDGPSAAGGHDLGRGALWIPASAKYRSSDLEATSRCPLAASIHAHRRHAMGSSGARILAA